MRSFVTYRFIIIIIISILFLACSSNESDQINDNQKEAATTPPFTSTPTPTNTPLPTPAPTSTPSPTPTPVPTESPLPSDDLKESENKNDGINRPIIKHKADVVYFDEGDSFGDFSENVIEVTDLEDGNLSYVWYGGITGTFSEEELYRLTHRDDDPKIVESSKSGIFFTFGTSFSKNNSERLCVTNAFDSEGHASWKEYKIIYIPVDHDTSIGSAIVNVDSLNVRNYPSTEASKLGCVAINKSYLIYEIQESKDYTWYRIGEDLWIANDGTWVTFTSN